jgi:hypothetical protein
MAQRSDIGRFVEAERRVCPTRHAGSWADPVPCLLGDKELAAASFARHRAIVERFDEYADHVVSLRGQIERAEQEGAAEQARRLRALRRRLREERERVEPAIKSMRTFLREYQALVIKF